MATPLPPNVKFTPWWEPDNRFLEIQRGHENLFKTSQYSDMVLKCGNDSYHLHRSIVCERAAFFARACGGQFKEGATSFIELSSDEHDVVKMDDPRLVQYLIDYFYRLDYLPETEDSYQAPASTQASAPVRKRKRVCHALKDPRVLAKKDLDPNTAFPGHPEESPLTHAQMYVLGDFYGAPHLKKVALDKFKKSSSFHWETVQFEHAVQIVFSSTVDSDTEIRGAVAMTLVDHQELMTRSTVDKMLQEHGDLAYRVLRAKLEGHNCCC